MIPGSAMRKGLEANHDTGITGGGEVIRGVVDGHGGSAVEAPLPQPCLSCALIILVAPLGRFAGEEPHDLADRVLRPLLPVECPGLRQFVAFFLERFPPVFLFYKQTFKIAVEMHQRWQMSMIVRPTERRRTSGSDSAGVGRGV